MLPTHMTGALTKMRMRPLIKSVIWLVSFVMRVMSDPLSSLSALLSEKTMIFLNTSSRRSAPKLWETRVARIFRVAAKTAPRAVTASIMRPYRRMADICPVRMPSSIILDMIVGCIRSHSASNRTNTTAVRNKAQYFLKYLL